MTQDRWDENFDALLRRAVPLLPSGTIDPNLSLVDAGLDSLASVELLLELEDIYDITIPDEALTQETFGTPRALWQIVQLVQRGTGAGSA